MKSFRKSNLFTTSIMMLLLFSTIVFVGCEKENFSNGIEYLCIDGDLENPLTLLNSENGAIYTKATKRIERRLLVENGVLNFDNVDPDEMQVSPEICAYAIKNLELVNNKVREGDLAVLINKDGRLQIFPAKVNYVIRLKSGSAESSNGGQVNLNNMSGNEVVNFFADLWHSGNEFCLDSIIYTDSINWDIGFGTASYKRQGYINGRAAMVTVINRCYDDPDCNNNWSGNQYSTDTHLIQRNCYGNCLFSIWYY